MVILGWHLKKIWVDLILDLPIWVFWPAILKNYCHIWTLHSLICQNAKVSWETNKLEIVTKNTSFEYLGRILKKAIEVEGALFGSFGQHFRKTLLPLKSAPLNLPYSKVWSKTKNPKIWDLKCLIWEFMRWNSKMTLSYLTSMPP